jgi:hypothetical protein
MSLVPVIPPILRETFRYDAEQSVYYFSLREEYCTLSSRFSLANITAALDSGSEQIILRSIQSDLKLPEISVVAVDLTELPMVSVKVANRHSEALRQMPIDAVLVTCPEDRLVIVYFNLAANICSARVTSPPN